MLGVGVSFVIFLLIRTQARPAPGTMNKEYQEMTNEYLKVPQALQPQLMHLLTCLLAQAQNTEPISGVSSEGYKGKGQVQSGPKQKTKD